jgi:cobalt-zinc-cadmium efflux system membrane fusion protein
MKTLRTLMACGAVLAALLMAACSDERTESRDAPLPSAEAQDGAAPGSDDVAAVATCTEHGAPAGLCFFCDASLRDPARLWCAEHARYEDRCFICHPELRDTARLYCDEHGLYEDECFVCHPDLFKEKGASEDDASDRTGALDVAAVLQCTEHGVAEAECGICHPDLADRLAPGAGLKIRFASTGGAAQAGVATSAPEHASADHAVGAVGALEYNRNRLARITPLVDGVVRKVHADLGHEVTKGQPLVEVASPRIAEAKAAYLEALATETAAAQALARETELFEKNVSPQRDLIEARSRHAAAAATRGAAEQNLLDLGFDRDEAAAVARGDAPGSTVVLRAPFAGTIVHRDAVPGDVVPTGTELFRIADLDVLWLTIAMPESDVAGVAAGQRVDVHSDAGGRETAGTVTWVSSQLNETTRMVEIRAEVPNPGRDWRAGMFVSVNIHAGGSGDGLLVARDSVHRFGGMPFVFIEVSDGLYEVRRVDLAGEVGANAIVSAGLAGGERVVTQGSFLVKSEFQKSRLGAGCVD